MRTWLVRCEWFFFGFCFSSFFFLRPAILGNQPSKGKSVMLVLAREDYRRRKRKPRKKRPQKRVLGGKLRHMVLNPPDSGVWIEPGG
ncbi:hypothetical protein LZ31DRAFT_299952 [Colletotrichum somersetense]|nr:hypothetical protein LZ31DRAFT_299952 [Colletotrichum somersetense]